MFDIKYIELAKIIEDKIEDGEWPEQLPGYMVLAKTFNVHHLTVSKAIKLLAAKGKLTIRGTKGTFVTKKKPNERQTYNALAIIGLLNDTISMQETAEIEKYAKGYDIIPILIRKHGEAASTRLLEMPVDGVIFTNLTLDVDTIAALRQNGMPFISTNRFSAIEGVNWVDYDNENGLKESLEYLLSLDHKKIAYLAFANFWPEHEERMKTIYQNTMEKADCFDQSLYFASSEFKQYFDRYGDDCWEEYGKTTIKKLLNLPNPPTAIFVHNIKMANGVYSFLKKEKIPVPRNLSIIAGALTSRELTNEKFYTLLAAPTSECIFKATQILLKIIHEPSSPITQILLPRKLIVQNSTAPVITSKVNSKILNF